MPVPHNSKLQPIVWFAPAEHIRIALTTRGKADASDPYGGFNLADHVGDLEQSVKQNRADLYKALKLECNPCWLRQVHSPDVVVVDEAYLRQPACDPVTADASITVLENVPLAILTADCLPIVLWSDQEVAVVHAGWKGLAHGIIAGCANQFKSQVSAWIGPAIGPCHYEVDDVVRTKFKDGGAFTPTSQGHYQFDLVAQARQQLQNCGVTNVSSLDICTQCDERFYSYRRDGVTGRFATLVWRL